MTKSTSVELNNNLPSSSSSSSQLEKKADGISLSSESSIDYYDEGEPQLRKQFSFFNLLGVGFGLTNSWFGISSSMVTGITSGGPLMVIYGIIIIALISVAVGSSLGELSSAYPHAGGQFYWTLKLANKKQRRFLAYMTGFLSWIGSVFTSASTTLAVCFLLVGFYALTHPDFEVHRWHVFVTFEILHVILSCFNCFGKTLPIISSSALYISIFSFLIITIAVLSGAHGKYQSPKFVFATFYNETGWKNSGIAFILGLINPAWSFSCLDAATHMAFEVENPERIIPLSILGTVAIGFVTSLVFVISMFFCIQDLDAVLNSSTGFPILEIFHQALNHSKAGAIVLGCLILMTSFGCVIACHTWQARLCWSFARDNGLPYSKYWRQIDHRSNLPLKAHLMSCVCIALLGLLYLASDTAFNSLITGCISFLLFSYCIPVCLLIFNKKRQIAHGPFWLGKLGLFFNIVLLCWTAFALVFFSFPFVRPVAADNMNYSSVFIVAALVFVLLFWKVSASKTFRKLELNEKEDTIVLSLENNEQSEVSSKKKLIFN
ncbi:hypothetical protein QEN19_000530 [Hanseniaspora menglaensis]